MARPKKAKRGRPKGIKNKGLTARVLQKIIDEDAQREAVARVYHLGWSHGRELADLNKEIYGITR